MLDLEKDFYFEKKESSEAKDNLTYYYDIIQTLQNYIKKNIFPKKTIIQNYIFKINNTEKDIDKIKDRIEKLSKESERIEEQIYIIKNKNSELINKIKETLLGE